MLMGKKNARPVISIVIPVFNEEEVLPKLHERLTPVLESVEEDFEVVFVDDGSTDASGTILQQINEKDPRYKTVQFSRNFGHQTAISAGLGYVTGDACAIMDADLQDPPEVLPKFLEKWREGYHVVYAVRRKRKENIFKRAAYAIFYRVLAKISHIQIPIDSGDFCVMDRKIINLLNKMPERNRFVRGIRSWVGFRQIGLSYERDRRYAGEVKYTFRKLLRLAFDGVVSFSFVPLKMASLFGFIVSVFAFIYAAATLFQKLFTDTTVPGYTTTIILVCFLGGVQLITIGILGEYVGRIFDEVKNRPLYLVKNLIGFDDSGLPE
jgi:dolichol-phosphate mannosyltransferase